MSRINTHIRGNVVGYVALFVALTMGTAYATHPGGANTISSGDIINGEVKSTDIAAQAVGTGRLQTDAVTSAKVLNDQLRGADVDESTLSGVDAATLGGIGPSGFIQGQGQGRVLFNRVVQSATGGFTGTILAVPGFGEVYAGCDPGGAKTIFHNNQADAVHIWIDDGSADPTQVVLAGGGGNTTIPTEAKAADRVIFQVGRGTASDADHRLATIVVTSTGNGTNCIYQAQAITQRTGL